MAASAGSQARLTSRRIVAAQLGRDPRGETAVATRCSYGLPLVIRTASRLEDGSPFPTLYYLTCPLAVRAAGTLESSGLMRELNDRLADDPELAAAYREAHDRYVADRGDAAMSAGAGGMPARVKCLHALYAHEDADSNPVGALVRDRIDPTGCPGPCVTEDGARTEGHPGYARSRRR